MSTVSRHQGPNNPQTVERARPSAPAGAGREAPAAAGREGDRLALSTGEQDSKNPFAHSTGRYAADYTSYAATTAEAVKDSRFYAQGLQALGGWLPKFSGVSQKAGGAINTVADKGADLAGKAPKVAAGLKAFAKAAPVIGVGVSALDIGRAVAEKDPEKKRVAEGQAALSVGSSAAAIATVAFPPAAPVTIPLSVGLAGFALADYYLFDGAASKKISDGMRKVAGWVTGK